MIYDFPVPVITDTKNIKKTFGDPKHISKENLERLNEVVLQRTHFKEAMKTIKALKPYENANEPTIQNIVGYANTTPQLETIFNHDYEIKKNFKWTPILSKEKVLKFGKDIKFGKSGEIVMSLYSAFASQLKEMNTELGILKKSISSWEYDNTLESRTTMAMSMSKSSMRKSTGQKDVVAAKLDELVQVGLTKYIEAWLFLKKGVERISSSFQNLSFFYPAYPETQGISSEILLRCTQINANSLFIEILREQSDFEEMGRYAKSSALHAEAIDSYIKQFVHMMSPDFVQFICTVERLYKAIALWSLLEPCLKKLRREQYGEGESFSSLAELCCSFVDEINSLYKEIQAFPQPTSSPYYVFGLEYFEKIIFPKTLEYKICEGFCINCDRIEKVYGGLYKGSAYDRKHFVKIQEKDYIIEMTK